MDEGSGEVTFGFSQCDGRRSLLGMGSIGQKVELLPYDTKDKDPWPHEFLPSQFELGPIYSGCRLTLLDH